MRRPLLSLALVAALAGPPAAAEGPAAGDTASVVAANGVVIHGVDTRGLAERLRQVDRKVRAEKLDEAARDLAEVLEGNLDALVEDSEGVYLDGREATILRVAALPPRGLAAYRDMVDGRARDALEEGTRRRDAGVLAEGVRRSALSNHGPRLCVALADLLLSRGDLSGAARALEDVLRLWPESTPLPGVERAAVVSRLAALLAAQGDDAGVRQLADAAGPQFLASPSGGLPGIAVEGELRRAVIAASEQGRSTLPGAPTGALSIAGEFLLQARGVLRSELQMSREIPEHAVATDGRFGPVLVTRLGQRGPGAQVVALAPPRDGSTPPQGADHPPLRVMWRWPDAQRLAAFHTGDAGGPFTPAVVGDHLVFPWPSARSEVSGRGRFLRAEALALNDLVVLSISKQGRDVDLRGSDEPARTDADEELGRLSFCGRPVIQGDAIFTTLVGRAPEGESTELHVARFDLVPEAGRQDPVLRLRWRRHVLDGLPAADARFPNRERVFEPLALPASMAQRHGRLYVGSNTGAMACLEIEGGRVVWIETYAQSRTVRHAVREADLAGWKHGPVLVDGHYVFVAPTDADRLLRYMALPVLPSRSTLVDRKAVRGMGTSTSEGSELGDMEADELLAAHDGVALVCGKVPPLGPGDLTLLNSPLAAYRLRDRREGESGRRVDWAQIPEYAPSGRPAVCRDGCLFPTFKGIYRVALPELDGPARAVYRPDGLGTLRMPDRIGNLVADGERLWSVTPTRVVLLVSARK